MSIIPSLWISSIVDIYRYNKRGWTCSQVAGTWDTILSYSSLIQARLASERVTLHFLQGSLGLLFAHGCRAATKTRRRQIAKAWDLNWGPTTTDSNCSKEMRRVISLLKSETGGVTRLLYQNSTIMSHKTKDSAEFLALFSCCVS